jgi:hypothetical protein
MICTIFYYFIYQFRMKLPLKLVTFPLIFAMAPILSIIENRLVRSDGIFNDLGLAKAFLFFSFIIPIYIFKLELLKNTLYLLNFLSILIIFIYILSFFYSGTSFFQSLISFGLRNQNLLIGQRTFSKTVSFFQVYYVSSPLLLISLSYYSGSFFSSNAKKLCTLLLLFLSFFGLICAGTKANYICAFLIPISLFFFYSARNYMLKSALILSFSAILYKFRDLLSVSNDHLYDTANSIKLNLLYEYFSIFSNTSTLLWGDGLGSYRFWLTRHSFNYLSEWTYLEIIRWFGIFMCPPIFFILGYPFFYFFKNPNKSQTLVYLIFAYAYYLLISIANPLLFSSLGMLLLCLIYSEIFCVTTKKRNYKVSSGI